MVSLIGSATPTRPADLAVHRHEHHRLPLGAQLLGAIRQISRGNAQLLEQFPVAEGDPFAVHLARHALTRYRGEILRLDEGDAPLLRSFDDRRRQGVLAAALEAGRQPQQVLLRQLLRPPRR